MSILELNLHQRTKSPTAAQLKKGSWGGRQQVMGCKDTGGDVIVNHAAV